METGFKGLNNNFLVAFKIKSFNQTMLLTLYKIVIYIWEKNQKYFSVFLSFV